MKSYLNFRDKKEINNPTKISFTLEWSIEEIQEMAPTEKTKGQIEDLIVENQERFMELIAYIADSYLTKAVWSTGCKSIRVPYGAKPWDLGGMGPEEILYSIADDITPNLKQKG